MKDFEDIVKQVYFYCDTKNIHPNGIYGEDGLDLMEFASKLIAVWEAQQKDPNKNVPALLKK